MGGTVLKCTHMEHFMSPYCTTSVHTYHRVEFWVSPLRPPSVLGDNLKTWVLGGRFCSLLTFYVFKECSGGVSTPGFSDMKGRPDFG